MAIATFVYDRLVNVNPSPFSGIKKYTAFGNPDKLYCDTEYCYVNERKIKKFVLLKVELCFLEL